MTFTSIEESERPTVAAPGHYATEQEWRTATSGGVVQSYGLCDLDEPHAAHVFTWAVHESHTSGWSCPGQWSRCRNCEDGCLDCRMRVVHDRCTYECPMCGGSDRRTSTGSVSSADGPSNRGSLAERMKVLEHAYRSVVPADVFSVLRVDGRAFHTWTRGLDRPFDARFTDAMHQVAVALCTEVQGVLLAYVQSDEVSVIVGPSQHGQAWFSGVVAKQVSIAASLATVTFNAAFADRAPALFDARVSALPDGETDVLAYLRWRQRDAVRNSVSMLARSVFSASQLRGVKSAQAREMLTAADRPWEQLSPVLQRGAVCVLRSCEGEVSFVDGRTQRVQTTMVHRRRWQIEDAPDFAALPDLMSVIPAARSVNESLT